MSQEKRQKSKSHHLILGVTSRDRAQSKLKALTTRKNLLQDLKQEPVSLKYKFKGLRSLPQSNKLDNRES